MVSQRRCAENVQNECIRVRSYENVRENVLKTGADERDGVSTTTQNVHADTQFALNDKNVNAEISNGKKKQFQFQVHRSQKLDQSLRRLLILCDSNGRTTLVN